MHCLQLRFALSWPRRRRLPKAAVIEFNRHWYERALTAQRAHAGRSAIILRYYLKSKLMKSDYEIPMEIYERVHELMLAMVDASEAGDDILRAAYHEQLREFCEQQTTAGQGSGFLWEALADITEDEAERLSYYEQSLAWARRNSEPMQTVLLELGEIYGRGGDWQRAERLLIEAREEAIARGDSDTEGEAALLLLQLET